MGQITQIRWQGKTSCGIWWRRWKHYHISSQCYEKTIAILSTLSCLCCLILTVLLVIACVSLTIYFGVSYEEKRIYHPVDTIQEVGTNKYQASVQCLGKILQNITNHCGNYEIKQPCSDYPDKKAYTEIKFNCTNEEFISYLYNNSGGKETTYKHKEYKIYFYVFFVFAFLVIFMGGCFMAICGVVAMISWDDECLS